MKTIKNLLIIGFILIIGMITAQTPYYYYYQGVKQYLNLDQSHLFISVMDTSQFNIAGITAITKFSKDISAKKQVRVNYTKRYWQEVALQEIINQSSDLQEIEFETQTLLIGREDYNYAANLNYEFSSTEENQYLFTVNITGGYTMMDYGFWYGIIVSKLLANSEIVFNINKQNNQ